MRRRSIIDDPVWFVLFVLIPIGLMIGMGVTLFYADEIFSEEVTDQQGVRIDQSSQVNEDAIVVETETIDETIEEICLEESKKIMNFDDRKLYYQLCLLNTGGTTE